jgi:hypothetical protein
VRGLLVGITGLLGAAAFWRRRRQNNGMELQQATGPDPALELRAKLTESRATGSAVAADEPEPIAAPEEGSPLDPERRRQNVHDRARASIDELK